MPTSEKPLSDKQIRLENAKSSVRAVFEMINKNDQNTDNAYLLLTLICNCTMNLEINNLADLDQIMGAVNLGMKSAIEERANKDIREAAKKQKFII